MTFGSTRLSRLTAANRYLYPSSRRTYSTAVARFQTFWNSKTATPASNNPSSGSGASKFETLRSLEVAANNEQGNVSIQEKYLHELYRSGFSTEVVQRVESGQFAVGWGILELYVKCLEQQRLLPVAPGSVPSDGAAAKAARSRLAVMWANIADKQGESASASARIPGATIKEAVYGPYAASWPAQVEWGVSQVHPSAMHTAAQTQTQYSAASLQQQAASPFAAQPLQGAMPSVAPTAWYNGSAGQSNYSHHQGGQSMHGGQQASSWAQLAGAPGALGGYGQAYGVQRGLAPNAAAAGQPGWWGEGSAAGGAVGGQGATLAGATGQGFPGSKGNPIVVEMQPGKQTMLMSAVRGVISIAIFGFIFYQLSRSMPGGGALAQLTGGDIADEVTDVPTVRFADVKGVDEAKHELQDVVAFLRDPERFKRLGAKVPRGVLLTGPPGTGKTMLARAVAGEAGCKFYSKSASEFEEMLVGLGAKRVRDLFAAARKNAPAIIFIDEIDALGGKRRVSIGGGSERQTLNQLLSCMDGFTKNENVIIIAATNSPEILDPALVRPGRFDSSVDVPLPDVKGRKEILDLYLSKVVVGRGIDSELMAKATPGFSGAQLEALVNSAALMAANRGSDQIEQRDVEEARDKLIMGPAKKSRVKRHEQMKLVAYHEGGHTLAHILTKGAAPLHKVTILPRGHSGGATYSLPKDTDELMTRENILAYIDVCMGGRVAEELIYGPERITIGAGMDMQQASEMARRYCMAFSMSNLGLSSYSGGGNEPSPATKAAIDAEVERILQSSYNRVKSLISDPVNKQKLDRLATALLEHETLDAEEVHLVVEGKSLPSLTEKLSTSGASSSSRAQSPGKGAKQAPGAAAGGGKAGLFKKGVEAEGAAAGSGTVGEAGMPGGQGEQKARRVWQ